MRAAPDIWPRCNSFIDRGRPFRSTIVCEHSSGEENPRLTLVVTGRSLPLVAEFKLAKWYVDGRQTYTIATRSFLRAARRSQRPPSLWYTFSRSTKKSRGHDKLSARSQWWVWTVRRTFSSGAGAVAIVVNDRE